MSPISSRKQRPAVGRTEKPDVLAGRAGERSPNMTEQFGFQQLFRNCAAVDGHEGRLRAWTGPMNRARQHFFPGSALAADENAGVRRGNHPRFLHQFGHATAAENDALAPGFAVTGLRPGIHRRQQQRLLNLFQEYFAVEGLGQVAKDAARHRLHGVGNRPVGGEQNHRQRRPGGADFLEQGPARPCPAGGYR